MAQKIAIFIAVVLIGVILFIFAYYNYPILGGDAMHFVPAAINFARGNGLINELTDLATYFNSKFVYYTPLFPMLVGYFLSLLSPTYNNVFYAIAFINFLVIIVSSILFYKVAITSRERMSWFTAIIIILNLFGFASVLINLNGRPENLASLILIMGLLYGFFFHSSKYFFIIEGILLGFMAAAHPAGAVLSAIFLGLFLSILLPSKKVIYKLLGTYFVSLVVFLILLQLSPYSIYEVMVGVIKHAKILISNSGSFYYFKLLHYYFLLPWATLIGVILIFCIGACFRLFILHHRNIASPVIFYIFTGLIVLVLYTIIIVPERVYYVLFLLPLSMAFIIYYERNFSNNFVSKLIIMIVSVVLIVGFTRGVALFPYFIKYGITLNEARSHFLNLKEQLKFNDKIGISSGLVGLSDDHNNLYIWPSSIKSDFRIILYQQNYSGRIIPPEIKNCKIIDNAFIKKQPKFFGIKLANTMPGYAFAVYEC